MARGDRRKCKCCLKLFRPDPRNRHHQHYCSAPNCKTASKAASIGPICRLSLDCYRKVMNFIRAHPNDYEPDFEAIFQEFVNRLDPPIAS